MSTIIAVDPGVSGGIAYADHQGHVRAINMPDDKGLIRFLQAFGVGTVVYIEFFNGFMSGGLMFSAIKLKGNAEFIRGACMALSHKVEMIPPQVWQAATGIGKKSRSKATDKAIKKKENARFTTEWKNKIKDHAIKHFPDLATTLKTSDALSILKFAMDQRRIEVKPEIKYGF